MGNVTGERYRFYDQPFPDGDYRFVQLGFVVNDLLASARRWVDVLGAGPFFVMPHGGPMPALYHGEPSELSYQIAVTQLGPVQIELIQSMSDIPSVYRDVYGSGEQGVHQLSTVTKNFDAAMIHYRGLGYEPMNELQTVLGRVAYFDTRTDFGLVTEVIEESPVFLRTLSKTAAVCATWDGTDPIRILRAGGGYDVPPEEAR
jgi:hypothetical protein